MSQNARGFYVLILHPSSVLNSFFNSFLEEPLGFSICCIMSSANSDSFTSSFPIWMPFIFVSCLFPVARTYNIMLTKINENRHPCLVPKLRGNAFCFLSLNMIFSMVLLYTGFIVLQYVPSAPSF